MQENKISITINRPVSEVFNFTIDPANTPKWIDDIKKEETNEWPIKIGSVYRNIDGSGKWTEYTLMDLEENRLFELASKEGGYHVRYIYTQTTGNISMLEYFEWVDDGELLAPFSQVILERLKDVMESDSSGK
jgi:hypothetical protein